MKKKKKTQKKQGFYTKTDQLGIVFIAQLPRKKAK